MLTNAYERVMFHARREKDDDCEEKMSEVN